MSTLRNLRSAPRSEVLRHIKVWGKQLFVTGLLGMVVAIVPWRETSLWIATLAIVFLLAVLYLIAILRAVNALEQKAEESDN